MKKRASAFKTLKVADSLASAKVSTFNSLDAKSFGFAVLDGEIILVHGAFYSLYLQFPLSLHVAIMSHQFSHCMRRVLARVQNTHGHRNPRPLVPCLTLQQSAMSTFQVGSHHIGSVLWNVEPPGHDVLIFSFPSRFFAWSLPAHSNGCL